jgi:hypothetical protein
MQKAKNLKKTCLSANLSTTNPTRTDQGLHGEKVVTNCLSHGMVYQGVSTAMKIVTFLLLLVFSKNQSS